MSLKTKGRQTATELEQLANRYQRDSRALAVSLTLLIHMLILWLMPNEVIDNSDRSQPVPKRFEIQLEPVVDEEIEEKYVRAAPNPNEEIPLETPNISDRNQVAAQPEEALLDPNNTPAVDGMLEESNRIVQGNPEQIQGSPGGASASETEGTSPVPAQIPAPENTSKPLPADLVEQPVVSEAGIASSETVDENTDQNEDTESESLLDRKNTSPQNGEGEAKLFVPQQAAKEPTPDPRPRVRIEQDNSFGPIKKNQMGAIRIGNLSFDSKYSEFGEYWTRVTEIIEARWRNLVYNTRALPQDRSQVRIRFFITRTGEIARINTTFSNSSKLAETISTDAIISVAPFFDWTPEMIVRMGEEAECEIVFYY